MKYLIIKQIDNCDDEMYLRDLAKRTLKIEDTIDNLSIGYNRIK